MWSWETIEVWRHSYVVLADITKLPYATLSNPVLSCHARFLRVPVNITVHVLAAGFHLSDRKFYRFFTEQLSQNSWKWPNQNFVLATFWSLIGFLLWSVLWSYHRLRLPVSSYIFLWRSNYCLTKEWRCHTSVQQSNHRWNVNYNALHTFKSNTIIIFWLSVCRHLKFLVR